MTIEEIIERELHEYNLAHGGISPRDLAYAVAKTVVEELLPWTLCRYCDMGHTHNCELKPWRNLVAKDRA